MDLLHKLTQHQFDTGEINAKKLAAPSSQQYVFSNLVPTTVVSTSISTSSTSSSLLESSSIEFVYCATDQKHFFFGKKSNERSNQSSLSSSSSGYNFEDENTTPEDDCIVLPCLLPSAAASSVITALHLISSSATTTNSNSNNYYILIAALNNQQIYGWSFTTDGGKDTIVDESETENNKSKKNNKRKRTNSCRFSSTEPTLIGFYESDSSITSIVDVPFPSSSIFYVVFGSDNSSASSSTSVCVCCLEISSSSSSSDCTVVSSRPMMKHFGCKSTHVRIIVDRRKMTLSIVHDKELQETDHRQNNQQQQQRYFVTYFLPAVFSKTRQMTSFTQKESGLVSTGRYLVPTQQQTRSSSTKLLKHPIICNRKIILEDADRLRGNNNTIATEEDRDIVTEVLLHFSPSSVFVSENNNHNNQRSKTIIEDDETAEERAKRFFDNPYWLSGGLSTVAPDVCSVLVDFPRLVQNLRIVMNLHQKTIASPGYSHYFAQQKKQYLEQLQQQQQKEENFRNNNSKNISILPLIEEYILYHRAIEVSEFALRLLLSRPDVPRKPLSGNNNGSMALSSSSFAASGNTTNQQDDENHNGENNISSAPFAAADESSPLLFDFNCVARIPQVPSERAEFGVFAIALATSLPATLTLKSILQTFSNDYGHLSFIQHQQQSNNNNNNHQHDAEFIFFAVAGMIVDVIWPKNTKRNRSHVLSEFLMTIIPFLLYRDPLKDNTSTNTLLRNSSKFLFGACLDRLVSSEKYKLEEILVQRLRTSSAKEVNEGDGNRKNPQEENTNSQKQHQEDVWEQASKSLSQPEALISLLLLIRSVRVMSAAAATSLSPTSSHPGSPTTTIPQNSSASSLADSQKSSSSSSVKRMRNHEPTKHSGLSQQDIDELGNYSPSPELIEAVGHAVVDTARNYRCRNNNNNINNNNNDSSEASGVALQVISEGWNIFGGYVPVSERKLMVARMMMDAVVRHDISSQTVLSWTPLTTTTISSSVHNNNMDQQQRQQLLINQQENSELSATFPIIKMLAKIASTMNLAKAIELFAWVCTLEGSDGGHRQLKEIAKEAGVHDNVGISIVVLRVLTHLIEIQPTASRRFIHNILSFVWASIDPAVNHFGGTASDHHHHHQNSPIGSTSSSPFPSPQSSSHSTSFLPSSSSLSSPGGGHEAQNITNLIPTLPPARPKSRLPFVARLFRSAGEHIPSFSFHQASQRVLASNGEDGKVVLYDTKSTSKLAVFGPGVNNNSSHQTSSSTSSSVKHFILSLAFSPNGDSCALLQQYIEDGALSVAVYSIDEANGFFSTLGLAAAVTCNLKTEVPVVKGNGNIATLSSSTSSNNNNSNTNLTNLVFHKAKVVFASPKCAIVSFGSDDVMVHF